MNHDTAEAKTHIVSEKIIIGMHSFLKIRRIQSKRIAKHEIVQTLHNSKHIMLNSQFFNDISHNKYLHMIIMKTENKI